MGVAVGVGGVKDSRGTVVALPDGVSTVTVGVETGGVVGACVLNGVGATEACAVGTSVGVAVEVGSLSG